MSAVTPKGLMWTYEDYAKLLVDGLRHEIIHGEHFVNPSPSIQHQHVYKRLQYQLYTKIELAGLGLLYKAPVDVQLSEFDIVQPDIVIILNENVRNIWSSTKESLRYSKRSGTIDRDSGPDHAAEKRRVTDVGWNV
jgi:hypothetical protein